jgi:Na+/H+-dicarboxylate symporter
MNRYFTAGIALVAIRDYLSSMVIHHFMTNMQIFQTILQFFLEMLLIGVLLAIAQTAPHEKCPKRHTIDFFYH